MQALKKKRGTLKGQITRAATYLQAQKEPYTCTSSMVEIRISELVSSYEKWDIVQQEMEEKGDAAQIQECMQEREAVEETYFATRAGLMDIKKKVDSPSATATAGGQSAPQIKLPTLNLPSFSGNYQDWTSFHDLFLALVDKNPKLSPAQKLQYLKSSRLLNATPVTDANYDQTWKSLTTRYDHKRLIINAHLKAIFNQPPVTSENAEGLRKLLDTTMENLRALSSMKEPTFDSILIYTVCEKLDKQTRKEWELEASASKSDNKDSEITFDDLAAFLEKRCQALESSAPQKPKMEPQVRPFPAAKVTTRSSSYHTTTKACVVCNEFHLLYQCPSFRKMKVKQRTEVVRNHTLCFNCLSSTDHVATKCTSSGRCRQCGGEHHTLLHYETSTPFVKKEARPPPVEKKEEKSEEPKVTSHLVGPLKMKTVLLMTALVPVRNSSGQFSPCRALLDTASQASFMSEACAERLGIKRSYVDIRISGIGNNDGGRARGAVRCRFKSSISDEYSQHEMTFIVLPKLTGILPSHRIHVPTSWSHLVGLQLADPEFHVPSSIDILLGADIVTDLLLPGTIPPQNGGPGAYKSIFGFVLCGPIADREVAPRIESHHVTCETSLDEALRKFWELEEVEVPTPKLTPEEKECERHFVETHGRDSTGRYVVRLPFKTSAPPLGDSRYIAVKRLEQNLIRLRKDPKIKEMYDKFMDEYVDLGHMEEVPNGETKSPHLQTYYLPHHGVYRESSETTKLRVVFNASSKSSSGVSLNDQLMVGPKLQTDLNAVLLKFRLHLIAFTADIVKMYRQILVDQRDRGFQRIVWQKDPEENLRNFELRTVTYGTSSAPFLAIRTLQQLAQDEKSRFPLAAQLMGDFYVDDLISGAETVEKACKAQRELVQMLAAGGFELHKWSTNSTELLETIPTGSRAVQSLVEFSNEPSVTALGIHWQPATDTFLFQVKKSSTIVHTKRSLASEIAKLFDPMGWLAPVIIRAKILLQSLWRLRLTWDQELPDNVLTAWKSYAEQLQFLDEIRIPRRAVGPQGCWDNAELHGFSDSSETAYAAVVYLRTPGKNGNFETSILMAKTKVSPIKTVSLPRLELCAAVLLSRLIQVVNKTLSISSGNIHAWTDSQVVLAWIQGTSRQWKTFVANRVSEIQEKISPSQWHHVKSEENPADCASRGISPSQLLEHRLWFHGPPWLQSQELMTDILSSQRSETTTEELKPTEPVYVAETEFDDSLLNSHSDLGKILRVTAFLLRFAHNCKGINRKEGPLDSSEIDNALLRWIQVAQMKSFPKSSSRPGGPLQKLNPYRDQDNLLRVGGRLENANLSPDTKHPIILPRDHRLTELIVLAEHHRNLHADQQALLAAIRQRFWIPSGRKLIRRILHQCVTCFRARPGGLDQIMGHLPASRVQPGRAFSKAGVDYAGPISIRSSKLRKACIQKAYVCLFVCMATKAVHLELVSDLTSEAFLAALKRFFARRGMSSDLYSDNGTNFVGAARQLDQDFRQLSRDPAVSGFVADRGTRWHFIPPSSPHFGGLWEAGIKSTKYHLRRVMGTSTLTFEELSTVLAQIEACLNSRPLCPMSEDPESLEVLTPGHFLIGSPLNSVPERAVNLIPDTRLNRWQLCQKLVQHFWGRWQREYLSTLQQRPKWTSPKRNVQVGDLVLIREDNAPPLFWKLGRVISVKPGSDGHVRVVTLKTSQGTLTRSIHKLCLMPFQN